MITAYVYTAYAELIEEAKGLSDHSLYEIIDFIKFLKAKEMNQGSQIQFDAFKGHLLFMAEDFDETPDCFKEYM